MDTNRAISPAEQRHRHGFTLIELLVVIAIVVLLIGILIPSIAAIRRRGNEAVCLAHLAEFGRAHNLYADAHQGLFVPIHKEPDLADPWFGDFRLRQILGLPFDQAAAARGETNGGWESSLGDLGCPSVPSQVREKGDRHYGMNLNDASPGGGGRLLVVKRSDVVHPSEKVQMTDASTFMVWELLADPDRWDQYGESNGDFGVGVSYRHDRTANVLHFDGHAKPYDRSTLYSIRRMESDRLWNIWR